MMRTFSIWVGASLRCSRSGAMPMRDRASRERGFLSADTTHSPQPSPQGRGSKRALPRLSETKSLRKSCRFSFELQLVRLALPPRGGWGEGDPVWVSSRVTAPLSRGRARVLAAPIVLRQPRKTTGGPPVLLRSSLRFALSLVASFIVCIATTGRAQSGALVPYSQVPRTDKAGNEWNVEQNGMLNRPNAGTSLISGCAALSIANQQFYCNQPMATPDGREIVLQGAQPVNGIAMTRRIRFLDKEGGVRFIEQFTNSAGRDATITAEIRHSFNNSARSFLTDRARPFVGKLEDNESGLFVPPGQGSNGAPSLIFTVASPRGAEKPRISGRNQYQISVFHTLTVPAGKTVAIIHTVGQAKSSLTPDEEELQKLFRPLALARMTKEIPRDVLTTIVNLKGGQPSDGLQSWFPPDYWGIQPETFDVLAIGEGTRLKGKAQCAKLTIKHALGTQTLAWQDIAALAGARLAGEGRGCVWMRDGEMFGGEIEADGLRFTLVSGLTMDLKVSDLDRLVTGANAAGTKWPEGIAAFMETQRGERFALTEATASLPMISLWGDRVINLKDLVAFTPPEEGATAGLASLTDGSRIRLMPSAGAVTLTLKRFGSKVLPLTDIRQIITAEAGKHAQDSDDTPVESFVDLTGEQRLIARVTREKIRLATSGGLVELSPDSIRDMHDVTEDNDAPDGDDGRVYQAELWGGGTVVGRSADAVVSLEGRGYAWTLPMQHVVRIANPVPKIESAVMAKIGVLIRELGDEKWKTREQATAQLKELGALARPSLQEAAKQSTDAEVIRRVEELLQVLE